MSTLRLNQEPIKVDVAPDRFEAHGIHPFGWRLAKLTLEIDQDSVRLVNKKGKTYSTTPWNEIEDLKNEIRQKGRFSYRGKIRNALNEVQMVVRIGLNDADRERLAQIFDQLPQDVFGQKCPGCGGVVVENVCKSCGETFTGQQRRRGLRMVMIGAVIFVLGILITYATYNAQSGTVFVFYGAILIGAGLMIGGLIGLIFGTRV